MDDIVVDLKKVTYSYMLNEDNIKSSAIDDINVEIKSGEFIAILGHNGSGKSTLAKHINGLLTPTEGVVLVCGMDTKNESTIWDVRSTVGMVSQNPDNQIVATIVEEDVAFGPENLGVAPEEIRQRVDISLKTVGMYKCKNNTTSLLSGGQKQRIAIAGVLAMKPKCIVFDEATAMLDPLGRDEIMNCVQELNTKYGITVILITHFMEEAILADRIVVIDEGKVIIEGNPREVFSKVEKMNSIGLEVPQVTQLSYELKKAGFNISGEVLTIDEMVEELCQLK